MPSSAARIRIGQGAFRALCAKLIMTSCGAHVNVEKGAWFASDIVLGHDSALGLRAYIEEGTVIGNFVMMGADCAVFTRNHRFDRADLPMCRQGETAVKPVIIGDDVWLGARVILLPGAVIGHGAVIGAGSVVAGEIPPMAVAAGNPARVIRMRESDGNRDTPTAEKS